LTNLQNDIRRERFLIARLVMTAQDSIDEVIHRFGDAKTSGCFICLADRKGQVIGCHRIGKVLPGDGPVYMHYSAEKARRLGGHPSHMSSAESRNEARNEYGGAIRADDYIISCSGLPEDVDEAFAVALARVVQRWHPNDIAMIEVAIQHIARVSENERIEPVYEVVRAAAKDTLRAA